MKSPMTVTRADGSELYGAYNRTSVENALERAAKAAYDAMIARMLDAHVLSKEMLCGWEGDTELLREDWRAAVRAAILSLREPTDGMHDALTKTGTMWRDNTSTGVWQAMLDGVLK